MKTECEVVLQKALKYPFQGELKDGELLILKAPTSKMNRQRNVLKDQFQAAVDAWNAKKADVITTAVPEKKAELQEETSITGKDVLFVLNAGRANWDEIHTAFKTILTSGGCLIEGEFSMTVPLYDELDARDLDSILGEYMANFLMPS